MIRKTLNFILRLFSVVALGCAFLHAVELKPGSAQAFDRYIHAYERKTQEELARGEFLLIDHEPSSARGQAYERLRRGEVLIERRNSPDNHLPNALLHHWIGTAFFAGANIDQVFAVLEDYASYQTTYAPEVVRARVLEEHGDEFKVSLRLRKHKILTVLLDTDYDVRFIRSDQFHGYSRSYSTRIVEIEHPGEAKQHELAAGEDHGFLWRLYTYWRFTQRDGGVYAQCEAISLTRDVPSGLGWLVGGFVESIPRESLIFTLNATRKALVEQHVSTASAHKDQSRGNWR
jgi:hypothetical protein